MNHRISDPALTLIVLTVGIVFVLTGCSDPTCPVYPTTTGLSAGDTQIFGIGSVALNLQYCPGGTFPTGMDDSGSATEDAFWIGETEVTYALWSVVYNWATAEGGYTFANVGIQGDGAGDTNQHPVTTINWRDAMVFCNAITEYYNAKNGTETDLSCVYLSDNNSTPIRSVDDSTTITTAAGSEDNPNVDQNADGFHLPSSAEWECAARYIVSYCWTPGNYASGATAAYDATNGSIECDRVAVYDTNSGSSTATVKSKTANALGCYDMSGNVFEWNFDWLSSGSTRVERGGGWRDTSFYAQVGYVPGFNPYNEYDSVGFRLCRTAN